MLIRVTALIYVTTVTHTHAYATRGGWASWKTFSEREKAPNEFSFVTPRISFSQPFDPFQLLDVELDLQVLFTRYVLGVDIVSNDDRRAQTLAWGKIRGDGRGSREINIDGEKAHEEFPKIRDEEAGIGRSATRETTAFDVKRFDKSIVQDPETTQ